MNLDPESFGHYRIEGLLGRGGMGRVYRAHDTTTDRVVALKVLPPHLAEDEDFQRRFRREARIAAGLNDPHVVPIHGYGEIDGRLYVDMRLIEGRDLSRYIAEHGGRLGPDRAVAVIEQVAAALDSAHRVGLIHRDIKPMNILVTTAHDFVYLIDFGLARAEADTQLTNTGATMGTVAYLAPERFRGTTDHRADVYSLACVLYECLTGKRPFDGQTLEEQLNAHLNTPPPRPSAMCPDLPAAFDEVVARGMAKDPNQRYQSAIELAEAAKQALASLSVATAAARVPNPPPPPVPPPPPWGGPPPPRPENRQPGRRLVLGIVGASVVSLAAVTALVISLVHRSDTPAASTASTTPVHPRTLRGWGATSPVPSGALPMPAFAPPADLGANCQYPPSQDAATKPVEPPPSGRVSTTPGRSATISTNYGDIGIKLATNESPCTVNSFVSLVKQQFYNNTPCTRLGIQPRFGLLQCGATESDGTGGPGYNVADEYPADQYPPGDPAIAQGVVYPRGTVAMAPGQTPNTNSSVFNLVFTDSDLQATSTVFGTIDEAGLDTLDKISQVGVAGGGDDGAPAKAITVNSVRLD
ncbi:protein kinase domain-containing protein [Mycobacterium parmense]|uniref:non-specific serine/threonine protein kinase n=1 Tax=Mycobacterium parmense TaxID=185642 RepID=A0A7I7YUU8_9MYCO|nr:protein kinase [Mycobacterium parmense]MCV7351778.1 protein kinase [Mycobacterium parmense]ORW63001.1 protein kinase [Mycobacterium parmense]BBZ44754.1 hypothetical protein MPRM_20350 [Mycobacterium parmense]